MGKKRIQQLLAQMEEEQYQDLQNSAAIYTVAQVAIDRLEQSLELLPEASVPVTSTEQKPLLQPELPALSPTDKSELLRRYGSFAGCRKAAKDLGMSFAKTPSWTQLVTAWQYREGLLQLKDQYLQAYPTQNLEGFKIEIRF